MSVSDKNYMKTLIYKFQPIFFKDFEVNSNMILTLRTLVKMDKLNVLLVGDMGTGKTSWLNAIIREYYGDEWTTSKYEENVLHINNLKDQGINFYRNDVKTFCQTCCSVKKKKKFILLDDIDFINEQSQQVFRNCIDKYSHNVHFLASCKNIQKVIENLQSRFTIIQIKPLQRENLYNIMKQVTTQEKIELTEDAENFLLTMSNNNVKIMVGYLEKCILLNRQIDLETIQKACTNINFLDFEKYVRLLKEGKLIESIQLIYTIYDKGYSVIDILDTFFLFLKSSLLLSESEKYDIIPIICKYINVFHNIHEDEIEIALFTNNIFGVFSGKG
jgi:DNA polymerase III delta prime subunit